jgi:L-alanine-DL-glutamate epimerase-like enolase superfamily enzyme
LKITKIEVKLVRMPMRTFTDAYASYSTGQFALITIETDEGITGYGESPSTVTVGFYGETLDTVATSIRKSLAPALIGEDPENVGELVSAMNLAQGYSFIAKTGLNLALYDLVGKAFKIPASTLLGGTRRSRIRAASEIGITSAKEMVKEAQRLVNLGFEVIKLKAGKDMEEEMKGLKGIRAALGSNVELRVDPNAGWSRRDALSAAEIMTKYEVSYLEQPLPRWDLEGLAMVRKQTGMQIMVDESVWDPHDVVRVAKAEAADIINIKITKTGGLTTALEVYNTAKAFGISCVIGTELESCVALGAKLQIASAMEDLPYACEYTELAFQQLAINEQIKLDHGYLEVPKGNGLGVSPKLDSIERYSKP